MRYFTSVEPVYTDDKVTGSRTVTLSEEEIRETYYPYWYAKMCAKYGKEKVDLNYCFEDCLEDWKIINWAVESTE